MTNDILQGKNLQLEELVRVNYLPWAGRVYYLTIKATDSHFYEAEVYTAIRGDPLKCTLLGLPFTTLISAVKSVNTTHLIHKTKFNVC